MSTTTPQTSAKPKPTRAAPRTASRHFNLAYIGFDLRRNVRMFSSMFFVVLLPVAMFLIFGAMQSYSEITLESGNGNVAAQIMVSMACYGAITATASLAGTAAVELQQGWGRQLGLTPFSTTGYIVSKAAVAILIAALPIAAVYIAGAFTGAKMNAEFWLTTGLLGLLGSIVFALYGLMFGMLFRSESAVGAASGLVVILMFLGNAFVPLSGFLLDLAPFTPVWGVMQFALWPLSNGIAMDTTGGAHQSYEPWMPIVNIVVWAVIFGVVAFLGARRGTARR